MVNFFVSINSSLEVFQIKKNKKKTARLKLRYDKATLIKISGKPQVLENARSRFDHYLFI